MSMKKLITTTLKNLLNQFLWWPKPAIAFFLIFFFILKLETKVKTKCNKIYLKIKLKKSKIEKQLK